MNVIAEYGGEVDEQTAEEALVLLADAEPLVRRAAINVIRAAAIYDPGQPALFDLIRCLADSSLENRTAAFVALGEMGGALDSDCYFLLAEYLSHEEDDVRSAALEILLTKGQEDLVRTVRTASL